MSTTFGSDLRATVTAGGVPVAGVPVTFIAPTSGASGTFSDSLSFITVDTNSSGVADSGKFTANSTNGSYQVYARLVSGDDASTSFSLTNTLPPVIQASTGGARRRPWSPPSAPT